MPSRAAACRWLSPHSWIKSLIRRASSAFASHSPGLGRLRSSKTFPELGVALAGRTYLPARMIFLGHFEAAAHHLEVVTRRFAAFSRLLLKAVQRSANRTV